MSEPSADPEKVKKPKGSTWFVAIFALGLFIIGADRLFEILESNQQTWRLILPIAMMVCAAVGGAGALWSLLKK